MRAGTLTSFDGRSALGPWKFCAGDGLTGDTGDTEMINQVTLAIGR